MKGAGLAEGIEPDSEEMSDEDVFLEEAFDAVKEGDLEGFKAAMRGAIEACMGEE